jgi:uncharacterized protein YfaS (alpha-2-macroglobulin family)
MLYNFVLPINVFMLKFFSFAKNNKMRNLSLFLLLVWISACGKFDSKTVRITYRNFGEEIETRQNLVLEFNQSLAPKGMVGEWHDKAYFSLKPQVKGSFRWETENKLVFSPENGFAPHTDYLLTFSGDLTNGSGLRMETSEISFHTPYLDLAASNLFWTADAAGQPKLSLSLGFNYPINPTELQKLMSLAIGGKQTEFQVLSTVPSAVIQVAVSSLAAQENQQLNIAISEGLQVLGSLKKADQLSQKAIIPLKEKFNILAVEAEYIDGEPAIRVTANQALGANQLEKVVSLAEVSTNSLTFERTENGFIIKGKLPKAVTVTLKKSLKGVFGAGLEADFSQALIFENPIPSIKFAEKGNYLSTRGFKNIALSINGIEKIRVQIYKIYANNVMHYLRSSNQISQYYDMDGEIGESGGDYYYSWINYQEYGDLVYDQALEVKNLKRSAGLQLLHLDFEHNRDYKGIYALKISNYKEQYTSDSRMVSFSDIGLMAKRSQDEITVFAHSINKAEPLAGVEVTLVSNNNQEVYSLKTEPDGVARFSDLKAKTFGFDVKMIVARMNHEFTVMHFAQTKVSTEDFGLGGLASNAANLQAFVYAERELYRPGETLNLRAIVRDHKWQPLSDIPVKIKVLNPEGKEFSLRKGILTKEGSFTTAIPTPPAAMTGQYTVEILSANDVVLGSKGIFLEEFMPDRIKVEGSSSKTQLKTGETAKFNIQVYNLFGPPAVGRNVEISYSLSPKMFGAKEFKDYNFNFAGYGSEQATDLNLQNFVTDETGSVSSEFTFFPKNTGLYNVAAYITAFDETGRPVRRKISSLGISQEVFLGMQNRPRYILSGAAYPVGVVALNEKEGLLNNIEIDYKIIRHNWTSVLEQDYSGRYRYVSQRKEELIKSQRLTIGGKSSTLPFLPEKPGEYELRIARVGDESHYVSQMFYAYQWGSPAQSASYQISKEGKVIIETDKSSYSVGQEALLRFKVPFEGRLIVTVERDKLIKYFVLQTQNSDAVQKLKIDAQMLPNAYITATLIRPIQDNSLPITVAHGFLNLEVNEPSRRIEPKIIAAEKCRSGQEQIVTVQTGLAQAELSIAVVDEGILQIKNTKTPDPYGYFYQSRALEVYSYDMYSRVFHEYRPQASSFGSDFAELGKRLNPFQNKRIKPASFWSGNLITDAKGQASFSFTLPEGFSGQVRIMAVASKGHSFGSADKTMIVADPVVLSYGLPRFLSPGDVADIPATLTNTTASSLSGKASLSVEGPLEIVESSAFTVNLSPNSESRSLFKIKAKNQLGEGKVILLFDNGKEKFKQELEIAVRPPTTLTKYSGAAEAQSTIELDFTKGLIPATIKAKLVISQLPLAGLAPLLVQLVQYPYGCLEQTTSSAFPQLYVKELYESVFPNTKQMNASEANVQEAINKIKTMQRYDGSLSYWAGGDYALPWATVYATHFLVEAKKAGFEVDSDFLERLLAHIASKTRTSELREYFYENGSGSISQNLVPKESIYALYVLAVAGKPERSAMNFYSQRKQMLSADAMYMLAASYRLIGDQGTARRLQPTTFPTSKTQTLTGQDFSSYIRDIAVALNALVETDPQNAQIPSLAKELSEELSKQETFYYSTQEKAFALLALGKLAKNRSKAAGKATISANGKNIAQYSTASLVLMDQIAGKNIKITPQGGSVYYYWELEGLPENDLMPKTALGDYNLKVRREFLSRSGQPITNLSFNQNDLVVVKITLQSSGRNVDNVVITDILPAAFEVENPRLNNLGGFDWIKERFEPQFLDIRDDRVNFFTQASPNLKTFYYTVRVVSKGQFKFGPIAADAMYNAAYRSYNGGGMVLVE